MTSQGLQTIRLAFISPWLIPYLLPLSHTQRDYTGMERVTDYQSITNLFRWPIVCQILNTLSAWLPCFGTGWNLRGEKNLLASNQLKLTDPTTNLTPVVDGNIKVWSFIGKNDLSQNSHLFSLPLLVKKQQQKHSNRKTSFLTGSKAWPKGRKF